MTKVVSWSVALWAACGQKPAFFSSQLARPLELRKETGERNSKQMVAGKAATACFACLLLRRPSLGLHRESEPIVVVGSSDCQGRIVLPSTGKDSRFPSFCSQIVECRYHSHSDCGRHIWGGVSAHFHLGMMSVCAWCSYSKGWKLMQVGCLSPSGLVSPCELTNSGGKHSLPKTVIRKAQHDLKSDHLSMKFCYYGMRCV